jgi:Ca2+-binding EF-hand superfamily protein
MADLLTLQQIAELKDAFAIFDKDGDGSVTASDLAEVFAAVGQKIPQDVLLHMLQEADIDANGIVDFPEFLTLVANRLFDDEHRESDLKHTFDQYDLGHTGHITVSDLQLAMASLGCRMSLAEADEMLREADLDGDGKLSFQEYRRMMLTGD